MLRPDVWCVALLALATGACCSIQVSTAGYQRSCVPIPGITHRPPDAAPRLEPRDPIDASWDEELQIYVVVGRPCHFLRLGSLYRRIEQRWERAEALDGPWSKIEPDSLPGGLRRERAEQRCDASS